MKLDAAERRGDLYPDRHLNVFVPFHGHVLDANVTRAVVSTLRWARPEVTRDFVIELAGVEPGGAGGPWHFDLHASDYEDFHPASAQRQVVLGISVDGAISPGLPSLDDVDRDGLLAISRAGLPLPALLHEMRRALSRPELSPDDVATLVHSLGELEEGSIPDGWVFSPAAGTCVLVEAKLTRYLDAYQLRRYSEVFYDRGGEAAMAGVVLRPWSAVARFFAARRQDADPVTAFLCRQLHDYLDLLGLASFEGFRPYDFDPDAAQEAIPKFFGFVRAVREKGNEAGVGLGEARPAPTGGRLTFADMALPGELRLDLTKDGVRVELRIGDAPGGRFPGRTAVDALLAQTKDGERNPLAALDKAAVLNVRVERLSAAGPDGEAWPALQTYSAPLDPGAFGEVLAELRRQHPIPGARPDATGHWRRGALSIGRDLPRAALVDQGPAAVDEVLRAVGELVKVARALAPAPAAAV
jgi:hypothetical protein